MNEVTTSNELVEFSQDLIKQAEDLLGCKMDKASVYRALCIAKDTGLSIVRGEISVVNYKGKPTVQINKQGYLAYAARNSDYDGMEHDVSEDGETAWCKVYSKSRSHPTFVKIHREEFDKKQAVWSEKPKYMLEKTAISLALREAYPVLNGTYTDDEIGMESEPYKIEPQPTDIKVEPAKFDRKKDFEKFRDDMFIFFGYALTEDEEAALTNGDLSDEEYLAAKSVLAKKIEGTV